MDIAEKTVKAIMQEPIEVRVTINRLNLLHRIGILKKERKFILRPLYLGTLLRISKVVFDIKDIQEEGELKDINLVAKALEMALMNTDKLIDVIALAITNNKILPDKKLKKFLMENLDAQQAFQLVTMISAQINVLSFINSIILIKRVSLINQGEIIAPGESQEESKNTSGSDLTQ
jgi:hypothetical protein